MTDSFIGKLRHQRNATAAGGAGAAGDAEKAKDPEAPAALKEPELRGGAKMPAPKRAQGLSGAALRRTVSDVFGAAKALGIPGPLVAKYAAAMDQNAAGLTALADRIRVAMVRSDPQTRAVIDGLAARLLIQMSPGLATLDATSAGNVIRQIIETTADLIDGPVKPTPHQARALETLAHAIGKLNSGEIGAELRRVAKLIATKKDPRVLGSLAAALDNDIARIAQSAEPAALLPLFRTTLDAILRGLEDPNVPAEQIVDQAIAGRAAPLTDGQRAIAIEDVGQARSHKDQAALAEQQAEAELEALKEQYENNARVGHPEILAPLAGDRARADRELTPQAQLLWFGQVNANIGQAPAALHAIASVQLEHLAHAQKNLPPPEVVGQISQQILVLSQLPGVTADGLAAFAAEHARHEAPERLLGTLAALTNVLTQLNQRGVRLQRPQDLAALANGMTGRTADLADQGRVEILVGLLAAANDDPTRDQALQQGPRIATALAAMENGAAREAVTAKLGEDLGLFARAGLDFESLAAAYRTLPEDGLLRFAAIGLERGIDPDAWLEKLSAVFKNARGNKEHSRAIRNLIVLAENAGADLPRFLEALNASGATPQQITRTVSALLNEYNHQITVEQITAATEMLERKENVAQAIETKLNQAMVKNLGLDQLLQDANIKATDHGYKLVSGPLNQFFSQGLTNPGLDREMFKKLLIAVLEDRFDGFRFTTAPKDAQLSCLNKEQRQIWETGQTMTHVRLDANSQAELDKRVTEAQAIARALLERMTGAWGDPAALRMKHAELVDRLHQIDKNDRAGRLPIVRQIGGLVPMLRAIEWATELSEMTPQTTTPLRFSKMADALPSLGRMLGEAGKAALNELTWTIRIDDLAYSEVVTHDRLDLAATYRAIAIGTGCINHWPQKLDLLAYCIDPNKRMIMTRNQGGEERRAVMRLVERQDEGHAGEPMLLLERTYPDGCTDEEKQRLIEHMLRRAGDMGIAASYATEYYWDASRTGRGGYIRDMNAVLEDLNRRYNTTSERKELSVLNRAGNMPSEYLDSAPKGINMRGVVGERYYPGNQDTTFANEFIILEPKKD